MHSEDTTYVMWQTYTKKYNLDVKLDGLVGSDNFFPDFLSAHVE